MSDVLSTSYINNFVDSFSANEQNKYITPLRNQKSKYQNLSNAYSSMSSKVLTLKTLLDSLKSTGSSSAFTSKTAATSNSGFVTATATSTASASAYTLRVNQLAKSDIALSQALASSTVRADLAGTHTFSVLTGDGTGGNYTSNVEVELTSSETNQTVMEKIRDAINTDKAVVASSVKNSADSYAGGAATFKINLGGTETSVSVTGGGTYSDLVDELVNNINSNVSGITAEKIVDSPAPGNVKLKLTVSDPTKYVTISADTGFDVVADLGLGVTKEKGAAGLVTASAFSPSTGKTQFSLTSNLTGLDNRITQLTDTNGGQALTALGLNLNSTRQAIDQAANQAGFVYTDISTDNNLLNAKINFNGIDIQRNSNNISDLATGVTFALKSVMQVTDQPVSVTTSNDNAKIRSTIDNFISKFNDIYTFVKANSASKDGVRGVLISDSNSNSLLNTLKSIAYKAVTGVSSGDLSRLSDIGISLDANSGLTITNSTLLDDVLTNKASQVEAIFNSTDGIAPSLYNAINPFTGSAGYLSSTKSSYDRNISRINDQITSVQSRIDKSAEVLRDRYQQLQAQLAQLYTMQSMFSQGGFF